MPPTKLKLHKNTGNLKSIPRPSPSATKASSDGNAPNASQSEEDRQFELELYWCIQQLESSLSLPYMRENNKKMEETTKLIKTLKSGSQPIIRKRQIMRTTYGDYRSKMASEEQAMAVNPDNIRFEKPKEKHPKYHFVKKSAFLVGCNNFQFNFPIKGSESENPKASEISSSSKKQGGAQLIPTNGNQIVPSDNLFRFNFDIESE
ncbi:UPF0488 protein CG14286 isoform X1 [Anopheles funestus]|uniref:UPF0488 protein CG14286 isoform X1 n=1 Tax=Anopheles funestus TaxID=62324 RepID=UPI0020C5BDB5|nr:UPF0488 protein CG14286 isoform X1 [Anopheles funestus]